MAKIIRDGFEFFEGSKFGPQMIILKKEYLSEQCKYIFEHKINSIAITYFESGNISDLDFVKEIPNVEEVLIDDIDCNFHGLYHLGNLKKITLNVKNKKQYLDFSKFQKLEKLSIDWYNNFPDLAGNENLKDLSIWKFKPKSKSFGELSLPTKLEKLHITESNIIGLDGLNLAHLKEFEGHHCNSLESVKGVDNFKKSLKVLILDYCKRLSIDEKLQCCNDLEKLILGNCGNILSLKWLQSLKNLNHFSFWGTNVMDGNIKPCFGIKYVSFKDQKHYNHKLSEFRAS